MAQFATNLPRGSEWIYELKLDGYRFQAHANKNSVTLLSRGGHDWTRKFPSIVRSLQQLSLSDVVFDGEIVWLDPNGRSRFQGLQDALQSGKLQSVFYYVFDVLRDRGRDLCERPWFERRKVLESLAPSSKNLPVRVSETFEGDPDELFQKVCEMGLEGLVCKRRESLYGSGRSANWLKVKCHNRQEFVVGGYTVRKDSGGNIGALLLGVYEGSRLRYVGKVGAGFTDEPDKNHRLYIDHKQSDSPFEAGDPPTRGVHWVRPVKVVQVRFANWTAQGLLRQAVVEGPREDKNAKEVRREFADVRNVELKLTHPKKVLYANEGLTKLDVAQYYIEFINDIFPHIQGRPLALRRSPEGDLESSFFQKHLGSKHGLIEQKQIRDEKEKAIWVSKPEGLLALVQLGAYEVHCRNCHIDNVNHPDQFVIDIDPGPGVSWKQVQEAARDIKTFLEQLHLRSFLKLTGGKGLHIHVPIRAEFSWSQVKSFTQAFARTLEEDRPDLYVSVMGKSKRVNRIFIDYLRNSQQATAVAPYSLRVGASSSVALPIAWEELRDIKSGDQFSLERARRYLRRRAQDPWAEYFQAPSDLTSVIRPL